MPSLAPENWRAFGATVRCLRQTKFCTLGQLARDIPIAPGYLSMIEHGKVGPPSAEVIQRLAALLEVSPSTLLAQAGKLPPEVWRAFWSHAAIPPILSTCGLSLADAETFARAVLAQSTSTDAPQESAESA